MIHLLKHGVLFTCALPACIGALCLISSELRSIEADDARELSIECRCCGEYVNVWDPVYSNAVLEAILPHFSEFARTLDLPVDYPIRPSHVKRFLATPLLKQPGDVGGSCVLMNGFSFGFDRGHVNGFANPRAYFHQQDPDVLPQYYGTAAVTRDEAIELARSAIRKLGHPLEDVLAELEPHIPPFEAVGTNLIPHYRIQWLNPRGGIATEVEVNGRRGVIESLQFYDIVALNRTGPSVTVRPAPLPPGHPWLRMNDMGADFNRDYAWKLIPYVLRSIEDWALKLNLDLTLPFGTNCIRRFYVSDQGGWPHAEITLTNNWQFTFRNSGLTYAGSPRRFFESDLLPFRIKNYAGEWKLSEQEAIELARLEITRLGFPEGFVHTDAEPRVFRPSEFKGCPPIPRLQIEWNYPDVQRKTQWIQVEVDCGTGTVEALMFDDVSFWGNPPPIDVPISLAERVDADTTPLPKD